MLVVMLGAPWDACTVIHYTEEALQVPYREYISWEYPARICGAQQLGEFRAFVRKMEPRTLLRFDKVRSKLLAKGLMRIARMANCGIEAANGKKIHEVASECIASDPYFFVDVVDELKKN